jgi:glycosyltransferase involved in cell wall biosynthesis
MRIALTSNYSPWSSYVGGGQHSTHQLASALVELGHDVTVVWTTVPGEPLRPHPKPAYHERFARFVGRAASRNAPLRPLNALTVAGLVAELCREGLDVVHANGEEGALLGPIARSAGALLVVTPRYPRYPSALEGRLAPTSVGRAWTWLAHTKYPLLGLALRSADRVCPTSEYAANLVIHAYGLERDQVEVVHNGIDGVFRTRSWAPRGDAPILCYGRLDHDKGMDVLIDAIGALGSLGPHRPEGHRRRLRIIGRGDEKAALMALAERRNVDLVIDDWLDRPALADAIAGASLVVLPSRHESYGNAIAEAMAVGAPLITTTAGSIPELVPPGTGILVPPDDAGALAGAILEIEENPVRAAMLGAAARQCHATAGWDEVAQRFVAIYSSVYREPSVVPLPCARPRGRSDKSVAIS